MELKMETSLAYLLAEWMVMQKVQLMESYWVHLSELCSVKRMVVQMVMQMVVKRVMQMVMQMGTKTVLQTVIQMVMSSVCLSAERTVNQKVMMLDCPMVRSLVGLLAESMAMQKDLQMAHMRP